MPRDSNQQEMARKFIQLIRRIPNCTAVELREFAKECIVRKLKSLAVAAEREAMVRETAH